MNGERYKILRGDVLRTLREIPDESVQCCVTSPPYWGLRVYKGGEGMIGLEPTLAEHIENIVAVFREVRRVLRSDGVCFVNYGDAYTKQGDGSGLATKQRLLLPARIALALQEDGWWVRSEIIWAKGVSFCPTYAGSCMPSSVRDRPADSHEHVYMLTKAPRYFYDAEAVKEEAKYAGDFVHSGPKGIGKYQCDGAGVERAGWALWDGHVVSPKRNLRTVWTIGPQHLKEAHFAAFPEALVEPCILAGTSERGACAECGAPWRRVVDSTYDAQGKKTNGPKSIARRHESLGFDIRLVKTTKTLGWEPTCSCDTDAPPVPCVVLDPFSGSGTVGIVALRHGRSYIGCEIADDYADMAERRISAELRALDLERRLRVVEGRPYVNGERCTKTALAAHAKAIGIDGRRLRIALERCTVDALDEASEAAAQRQKTLW